MGFAVRIEHDVAVIIGVESESGTIPLLQLSNGMQFKVPFARVLGIEAENPAKGRLLIT